MIKFLCISDVHLDDDHDPTSNKRELFIKTAKWFADLIEETEPDYVLNLGDVNHRDGGMSVGTIGLVKEWFDIVDAACKTTGSIHRVIVGNHDQHTRDGKQHVLEQLNWLGDIVVDAPVLGEYNGLAFLLAPYRRDLAQYKEECSTAIADFRKLSQQSVSMPKIIFTHMDIRGAVMNSGIVCESGLDSNSSIPVVNGHYHLPQRVGSVTVVGAPQYTQFRDIDPVGTPERGALMVTLDENGPTFTRYANPHTNLFFKVKAHTVAESEKAQKDALAVAERRQITGKANVWVLAPSAVLEATSAVSDESKASVRRTATDEVINVEDTSISLDLAPAKAVEQYFKETFCTDCGVEHKLETGLTAIKKALAEEGQFVAKNNVVFTGMTIRDFMSIRTADLRLDKQGLVLIEGVNKDDSTVDSNEAGKSAIVEALLWCLFDQTSRGIGKDEIIRWGATDATVSVLCQIGSQSVCFSRNRSKGKPFCKIVVDGKDITPHDQRQATAKIESLIGISFEQFLLLVVMAQGFETKFTAFNDAQRKSTLESFLGLGVYDKAREELSPLVAQNRDSVLKAEMRRNTLESLIEQSTTTLSRLTKTKQEKQARDEETIAKLKKDLEIASAEQNAAAALSRESCDAAAEVYNRLTKEQNAVAAAEREEKYIVTEAKQAFNMLQLAIKEASEFTGMCPTCGGDLPEEKKTEYLQRNESRQEHHRAEIEKLQAKLNENKKTCAVLATNVLSLQAELSAAMELKSTRDARLMEWQRDVTALKSQLTQLDKKEEDFTYLIESTQKDIYAGQLEIVENHKMLATLKAEGHDLEYWNKAFHSTGIRSILLRNVVNVLNEQLRDLCDIVTGGNYLVQLSSTKELKSKAEAVNKMEVVVTPQGSYKAGSGGKRRKIDLILNLAISELAKKSSGFSCNLLFADEVLDNLDLTASKAVLDLLSRKSETESVFLISHNSAVKPLIPKVWTVTKSNGESTVHVS